MVFNRGEEPRTSSRVRLYGFVASTTSVCHATQALNGQGGASLVGVFVVFLVSTAGAFFTLSSSIFLFNSFSSAMSLGSDPFTQVYTMSMGSSEHSCCSYDLVAILSW